MSTILVQLGDHQWTRQALHLACAMARNQRADVTLLRMIPVANVGLLGTTLADQPFTNQEYRTLKEYQATAEDYGVSMSICSMQYVTLSDALFEAASHVDALAVFAALPQSSIPYWSKFTRWNMQRRLAATHRTLYTLNQPTSKESWLPSAILRAQK